MTDEARHTRFGTGHPAPGRHRVGTLLLVFSFMLVPVAWSIQLAAISSLAGLACLDPRGAATDGSSVSWAASAIMWVNLGALALGLFGLGLSTMNMRRSQQAADAPRGGVVKAGEGRVHWMAVGGFFVALVCIIAVVANTISIFWSDFCPL